MHGPYVFYFMPSTAVLVTVGSTRFDALVHTALSDAFLDRVSTALGPHAQVWIQYGTSDVAIPPNAITSSQFDTPGVWRRQPNKPDVFLFAFARELTTWVAHAQTVVSHGGTYHCPALTQAPAR